MLIMNVSNQNSIILARLKTSKIIGDLKRFFSMLKTFSYKRGNRVITDLMTFWHIHYFSEITSITK